MKKLDSFRHVNLSSRTQTTLPGLRQGLSVLGKVTVLGRRALSSSSGVFQTPTPKTAAPSRLLREIASSADGVTLPRHVLGHKFEVSEFCNTIISQVV